MGSTKKILFLLCWLAVLNWYHSESKKAVKGHCGSKGRKDRLRGCKKRDGSKKNLTANPTNTPTVEPTNSPTTSPCVDLWGTCALSKPGLGCKNANMIINC